MPAARIHLRTSLGIGGAILTHMFFFCAFVTALKRLLHGGVFIFVGVNKKHEKFSAKTTKNNLTFAVRPVILLERACEGTAYYAMKREIARGNEVTSVEYVRYRFFPIRNRAAETSPIHAYIARTECEPARKAGLFFGRGLIRTVVCIGNSKVSSVRIRTVPMPSPKTYEKEKITHGSSKEHDPHPPQGL